MASPEPIPLVDLRGEIASLRTEIDAAIARVLDSGGFILGPEVSSFESELAPVGGAAHAIGVSSGTDALLVALMALGVGAGDEVVTTPFSFFATAGAISRLGARPVFADIDDDSLNLDPGLAASACSGKTRAIITVHLYGRPAITPVVDGIPVVEDAAQSLSARAVEGVCSCVSFFPTKNLGAIGDGGAVLTNDDGFADRIKLLRGHGGRPKYYHAVIGGNFRLDALQAAILRVKLPHLAAWTAARRDNAARYRALFAAASLPSGFRLPTDTPDHIYNQFVVRAPRRDALREALASAGVATEIYYPVAFHQQQCFADLGYRAGAFPVAEQAAADTLALPIYPALSESQQARVVEAIAAFYRQ